MTNAPRQTDENTEAGFSLMEMLVVVFIIGLMSTLVILSMPRGSSSASHAADDVAVLLNRLKRESILLGEPVRWVHSRNAESFQRYQLGEWVLLSDNGGMFDRFSLDENVRLEIALLDFNGKTIRQPVQRRGSETDDAASVIVFLPTGEANEAQIRVSDGGGQVKLTLNANGDLTRDSEGA